MTFDTVDLRYNVSEHDAFRCFHAILKSDSKSNSEVYELIRVRLENGVETQKPVVLTNFKARGNTVKH